jgi:hypothetical protein
MLFSETPYENVLQDETGKMWPLGAADVAQLRNSGQVVSRNPTSSGGGGAPPGLDPRGRSVQAVPAAAGGQALGGAPMGPPTPSVINPPSAAIPPRAVPPGLDPRGRSVQAVPQAATPPPAPVAMQPEGQEQGGNFQRVMPRDRSPQQGAPQQRIYKQVGGAPGGWVDTQRQTSGWSDEQQQEMRQRALDSDKMRQDAANMQYEASYRQAEADKFRAEEQKAVSFNKVREEQQKLDSQNLYIESQQKKIGERLKAAREKQVDPTKPFQGPVGGIAGVLAVLGSAMGQYSAGINGGPNNALTLFNNMIERSVNEQLRLIEEEKEGALMSQDELNQFQFSSNEEKKALIRAAEIEGKQAELDSVLADKALIAVHPMAAQAKSDLADKLNQDLATLNSSISRTAGQRYQQETRGGVIDVTEKVLAQNARESGYRKTIVENEQALTGGGTADKDAVLVNGQVVGKTPEAKEVNAQIRAYMTLKQKRDMATSMIRDGSFLDDARYESLANDAMFDLAGAKGATIRSDTDVKQFGDMLGGTSRSKVRPENQIKIWNDTVRRAGNEVRNRMRQLGLDPNGIEPDETLATE